MTGPTPTMLDYPSLANPETAKTLGAFYTDSEIAEFLARWAIRRKTDAVIDPSFGGGVFLRAASKRISELGGTPGHQVHGVEIDPSVHRRIVPMLKDEFGVDTSNLVLSDFFKFNLAAGNQLDAVIGNPPFIRYQRFSGIQRHDALARAQAAGVNLSALSSSWAPFLVLSANLLKPGGRLAMVIPMELTYATYAKNVVGFLRKSFGRISILTFRKRLFPEISEDTLLLLCENRGAPLNSIDHYDLPNSGGLRTFNRNGGTALSRQSYSENSLRLTTQFISKRSKGIYTRLQEIEAIRLGYHYDIGIGYVTGNNSFFHLSPAEARTWRIPHRFLRRAVLNARAFSGLTFSARDFMGAIEDGNAGLLLHLPKEPANRAVSAYLRDGAARGVDKAFKCRERSPWFAVPHVYKPDCFLSYMSGTAPHLVANKIGAVAPNNLHILRARQDSHPSEITSAAWLTSLSQLSAEIEGHSLGGGMLKIEPREARRVLLPVTRTNHASSLRMANHIAALVRNGDSDGAQHLADKHFLQGGLGLTASDCDNLRRSVVALKERRMSGFR